jgi:hypothetical protein
MKVENYDNLIEYIKQKPTQIEKLDTILQYFKEHVAFDYIMIEHINEIVTLKFIKYADRLFPSIDEKFRNKALAFIKNSTNISDEYWERIKNLYLSPTFDDFGNEIYPTLTDAFISISTDYRESNGLLVKGIAEDIIKFAKKLCDDTGIPALIVKGISSGKMQHYWLDICIDNKELFYDITYSLYIRDNFCGMGKRYKMEDWLGITPKQMYKNQPTRTILYPNGFSLEHLALNNLPLCMRDFFEKSL